MEERADVGQGRSSASGRRTRPGADARGSGATGRGVRAPVLRLDHPGGPGGALHYRPLRGGGRPLDRSEEHTSELQSHSDLVCRLLLEKKKKQSQKFLKTKKLLKSIKHHN